MINILLMVFCVVMIALNIWFAHSAMKVDLLPQCRHYITLATIWTCTLYILSGLQQAAHYIVEHVK